MAEFKNQNIEGFIYEAPEGDGFNAMGHPVPFWRKQIAYEHAKDMGCDETNAFAVVGGMSEQLERDEPYAAMEAGMRHLDLTGTYRLMAVLLTAQKP